ncbi:hypothetical protein KI688_009461 [Linnemannia hyalina]|uniref:Uncharacterized protein n=1 Tax=Linnemannia hyalina TaxID=64524 RepID=A0A9P7XZ01_9FUNG|nr:hypothetical protein KI688_009461 [Linnemannia hyalina]
MALSMAQSTIDIHPSSPISPPSSITSISSHSSTGSCKSVQFSRFVKISFTYPSDEYDRSAFEPAKLTPLETTELIQLRGAWRQEMEDRLHNVTEQEIQMPLSPVSPLLSSSSSPIFPTNKYHGRPHSLLLPTAVSSNVSRSSPPCSPVLSHHDSCSSSSDDDEYPTVVSPALTAQQQQQKHRLKRFGSSCEGMLHRHRHLEQTTQCIA